MTECRCVRQGDVALSAGLIAVDHDGSFAGARVQSGIAGAGFQAIA